MNVYMYSLNDSEELQFRPEVNSFPDSTFCRPSPNSPRTPRSVTGAVLSRKPPQEKTATGLKNKKWVNPIYATSGEHQEEGEGKLKKKGLVPAPQPRKQLTMAERRKQQIAAAKKQHGAKPDPIVEADEAEPVRPYHTIRCAVLWHALAGT